MRYNNEVFVKYRIDKDSIVFWTSDINENISAAKVLNEFLYDFSKGKKGNAFHSRRTLPFSLCCDYISPESPRSQLRSCIIKLDTYKTVHSIIPQKKTAFYPFFGVESSLFSLCVFYSGFSKFSFREDIIACRH